MHSVHDDFRAQALVRQNLAKNARLPVLQRTHSIKSMGSAACACGHSGLRCLQICIRMSEAHAHTSLRRLSDHLSRTFPLRRDRDDFDMSARGLPEFLECRERGEKQTRRRMDPAPRMTDKRSLQMNADRPSTKCAVFRLTLVRGFHRRRKG